MAYSFKKKENISSGRTEYSRYYGNFRGVDFSNDHTQVNQSRLAYLVNMYKDYQSGQGEALETIPGFRRRCDFSCQPIVINGIETEFRRYQNREVYGIHYCKFKENGENKLHVLIHCGAGLYKWTNYPNTMGIRQNKTITVPNPQTINTVGGVDIYTYSQTLDFECSVIRALKTSSGVDLIAGVSYNPTTRVITYTSSEVEKDDNLVLEYYEEVLNSSNESGLRLYSTMNRQKSTSFIFNNKLYILDGKNYLVYDGSTVSLVKNNAFIPLTYMNIVVGEENGNSGEEYQQRNMLTPRFRHTFIADGTTTEYFLNENELDSILKVMVYGVEKTLNTDYTVDLANGKVIFTNAPPKAEDVNGYSQGDAGIEITASKAWHSIDGTTTEDDLSDIISKCTLCTTYDNRVFCTGNPNYPNHIFYCERNDTGYADPSFFGVLNHQPDGVGIAPITGIMCVSDTLMVLKEDTQQDSSIYFHSGQLNTGKNAGVMPRIYPSIQGLSGLGCVGACCNFLDDPVFISRLGVEGVSQLRIASERANEHRSRLVDSKLVNTNLKNACLEEWGGYLCLLTDGKIFLADSRQRYQDETGVMQYEWYYLENIGVYENQFLEYKYAQTLPTELQDITIEHEGVDYSLELANNVYFAEEYQYKNLCGLIANAPDQDGNETATIYSKFITIDVPMEIDGVEVISHINTLVEYVVHEVKDVYTGDVVEKHLYLCESKGNYTGGYFRKANLLKSMDDNLFFGCENGTICSFNFDMRDSEGEISPTSYNFDNRTIFCGCATLMDNCQIPHLTKTTIKRSTVIKTKSFRSSSAKVKVRTNKKPYEQIARINSSVFSFDDVDFSDFSFITNEQSLFAIKEKEKQWVEKQYYIYSDEYQKPFALYYVSFRYRVAGRYKE